MPYLKIQTNTTISADAIESLLSNASRSLSEALGKPESYIMVSHETQPHMLFGGKSTPLAYLELKSIGLPEGKTSALSELLCGLVSTALDIETNRIYIEFKDAQRHMWGWDGRTFAG